MDDSTKKKLYLITELFKNNNIKIQIKNINHGDFTDEIKIEFDNIKNVSRFDLIIKSLRKILNAKIDYIFDFNNIILIIYKSINKNYKFNDYINFGKKNKDSIFFGIGANGKPIFKNLDNVKSLLISGSSGWGKSNLLHNIILSYLLLNDKSYLMLIDPKFTELSFYKKSFLKNRLLEDVAFDFEQSKKLLIIYNNIISQRYKDMKKNGLRFSTDEPILLIIEEYASLFTDSKHKKIINGLISRIASLGRAARCYLIITTQHPTNANLTNSIRVNIQSKLALHCESKNQSHNIINSGEATELKSKGEFLLKVDGEEITFGKSCLITDNEISQYLKA